MNATHPDCVGYPPGLLASTGGTGLLTIGILSAALLLLGAVVFFTLRARRHEHGTGSKPPIALGSLAIVAALILTPFASTTPANAADLKPGLPAHCYEDPKLTVTKGDAGDDTHEVDAGEHTIVVTITNSGDESLVGFVFSDATESGQDVVWDEERLELLDSLVLKPGMSFTLSGYVRVENGETHRDTVSVTAQGDISGKSVVSSDPTTLIAQTESALITPVAPAVVEQCDVEPTVTLAETAGIEYTAVREGDDLVVTATAKPGFVIAPNQQTQWRIDMTFDTSVWDDASWDVPDPVGVRRASPAGPNDGVEGTGYWGPDGWVKVSDIPHHHILWDNGPNDDDDWIEDVLATGAEITVGPVEFETAATGNVYWAGWDWQAWFNQLDPDTDTELVESINVDVIWDHYYGGDGTYPETLPAGLPYPQWVEFTDSIPMLPTDQVGSQIIAPQDGTPGLVDTGVRNEDQYVDWERAFNMPPRDTGELPTGEYRSTYLAWQAAWQMNVELDGLSMWHYSNYLSHEDMSERSYAGSISYLATGWGAAGLAAFDPAGDWRTLMTGAMTHEVIVTREQGLCSASRSFRMTEHFPG